MKKPIGNVESQNFVIHKMSLQINYQIAFKLSSNMYLLTIQL
jgi:hypothetical protein